MTGTGTKKLVLASGFGPFEGVLENPSGRVLQGLLDAPPRGIEVVGRPLTVSFTRSREEWDEVQTSLGRRPDLCLAMGVAPEDGFRLERRARGALTNTERVDVDGETAAACTRGRVGELSSELDLERALAELETRGWRELRISEDAGGYVCESIYHHVLTRASELGCPGLFLHVPRAESMPVERQVEFVRDLLEVLVSVED